MRISDWSSDVCSSDLKRKGSNFPAASPCGEAAGPGTSEGLADVDIPVARDRRMERTHISKGTRIDGRLRIGDIADADAELGAVGETTLEIVLHIKAGGGVSLYQQILAVDGDVIVDDAARIIHEAACGELSELPGKRARTAPFRELVSTNLNATLRDDRIDRKSVV